ncbi:MAG: 16S rRNA (cytosine(1402)-N(4))-methyltransferase RsmH [Myxococcota bacterium]
MTGFHHEPVLLAEAVRALAPADGAWIVDCTVGGGGHSRALLEAARCRVIGLDRDPDAIAAATAALAAYGDRFTPVRARFSELGRVLDGLGVPRVHGILADLGVSSHQLDTAARGFSFRDGGPIDMRMDPDAPVSAADLVNAWSARELEDALRTYGEDRAARKIAAIIVAGRPWSDTAVLAKAIAAAVGRGPQRIHPATRTFQALRIVVNGELDELASLLPAAIDRLEPGGRIAVITFHSLEDRAVKRFFDEKSGKNRPKDPYGNPIGPVHLRVGKDVAPGDDEANPRARSARLRTATRAPWNT